MKLHTKTMTFGHSPNRACVYWAAEISVGKGGNLMSRTRRVIATAKMPSARASTRVLDAGSIARRYSNCVEPRSEATGYPPFPVSWTGLTDQDCPDAYTDCCPHPFPLLGRLHIGHLRTPHGI